MRNLRMSLLPDLLDAIEKPRDFSDVSLTHFAAEPHNNSDALRGGGIRGEGGGRGEVEGGGARGRDYFTLIQS